MSHVRAALYLDFDNVFSGLFKLDPEVAIQFATDPGAWLGRLSTTALATETPRRWLILRCYLNPAGSVSSRDAAGDPVRVYFSRFRPSFVRAGFEVIDCPRYNATKNGADIRLVIDAVDALTADTVYEEFVIASGDSDMTPLLQRLRRSDRHTVIVSPADAAEAYTSIADQVLDSQYLMALVQGEQADLDDDEEDVDGAIDVGFGNGDVADADATPVDQGEAYESFRSIVSAAYNDASEPLNKATLGHLLRRELGARGPRHQLVRIGQLHASSAQSDAAEPAHVGTPAVGRESPCDTGPHRGGSAASGAARTTRTPGRAAQPAAPRAERVAGALPDAVQLCPVPPVQHDPMHELGTRSAS